MKGALHRDDFVTVGEFLMVPFVDHLPPLADFIIAIARQRDVCAALDVKSFWSSILFEP
jgi:hypothetical protein